MIFIVTALNWFMKILLILFLIFPLMIPAFAAEPDLPEDYEQILPSEQGTLNIRMSVLPEPEPNSLSK